MFQSAALKLALWYLGIILAISVSFSVVIYSVSSDDLQRNNSRQAGYFTNILGPGEVDYYGQLRQNQLATDLRHLRTSLVFLNIFVAGVGGAASYALARRTLSPIEEALESQKRFSADASHELRTPLAAMKTEIEVALRDAKITKTEAVELLNSNLEEVSKLQSLSEGLLRLATRGTPLDLKGEASVKSAVEAAKTRYEKTAGAKKIKFKLALSDIAVRGDPQNLSDMVATLIDNAIKYSPSKSTVGLSSGRHGRQAFISVTDAGPGISEADLPHIFERFYRSDTSRNRSYASGYGLGLALAHKIAVLHGGHIEVKTTLGKGSTFTILLPTA